jgi:hypothetical protein
LTGVSLFYLDFSEENMSAEKVVMVAAAVMSIIFNYFPIVAKWYEEKSGTQKRQIMGAWLLIVTAGIFAISCVPALIDLATQFDIVVECSTESAYQLIYLYLLAITANQAVWLLSPKTKKVTSEVTDNGEPLCVNANM